VKPKSMTVCALGDERKWSFSTGLSHKSITTLLRKSATSTNAF
jgi:hypothetical protein